MNAAGSLAIVAAVLAVGAVVLRDPPTMRRATVDLSSLAKEVDKGADHVSVEALRAMVGTRATMRLIDLRSPEAFAAGHVPSAENVPLARLDSLAVRRDEPVILYSDGGIHSSQAWYFLRARGITNVRFLLGGYDEWLRVTGALPVAGPAPPPDPAVREGGEVGAPAVVAGELPRLKPRRHRRDESRSPDKDSNAVGTPVPVPATPITAPKIREGC